MWIMLNDAFFSIVAKDCNRDQLMVRARRPGDIEKVFPSAKGRVTEFTASDYHYRCAISKIEIKRVMCGEIDRITYSNFKDSVKDRPLHNAYIRVWDAMSWLQPKAPYAGRKQRTTLFDDGMGGTYRPGAVIDADALTPDEYAHVFATGHMPDEDFPGDLLVTSGIDSFKKPRKARKAKRSLKKGR